MKRAMTFFLAVAACAGLCTHVAPADTLFRSGFNYVLDKIDTSDYSIMESVPLPDGIFSLAMQPGTNVLYGISYGVGGDNLVTIDPVTGDMTSVVLFADPSDPYPYYSGITFAPDGTLYAVATPDCGFDAGAILEVDMGTGGLTDTGLTYSGEGGQSLEFNPDDGLFYHFFNDGFGGGGVASLETVDPLTGTVTDVPLTGYDYSVINGVVYAGDGKFYAYDNTVGDLLEVTTDGAATLLHTYATSYDGHGLALDTYVPEPGSAALLGLAALCLIRRRRG